MSDQDNAHPKRPPQDVVILLCGGSNVGKSYMSRHVFAPLYRASVCVIDKVYTTAVIAAGMVDPSLSGMSRKEAERAARIRARARKWKNADEGRLFMASYESCIREALTAAAEKKALAVFEGGTLIKEDEIKIVSKSVRETLGGRTVVQRLHLSIPYGQWLEQRIKRKERSKQVNLKVASLTRERFETEMNLSRPRPYPGVQDVEIQSVDEVHELLRTGDVRSGSAGWLATTISTIRGALRLR